MTEIERMHEDRINALDRRIDVLGQKIDDFIAEMRRTSDRQDARFQQLEQRMDATNLRIDTTNQRLDAMSQKMDDTLKNIQNLTVAAIVGIGAAVLGMGALSVAVISFVIEKRRKTPSFSYGDISRHIDIKKINR